MNNNQFDNLTRTLANRISRRDVLKVFAASIASALFSPYGEKIFGESFVTTTVEAQASAAPPLCPIGGSAPQLIDPHIASGSLCRGACGVDCPSNCTQQPDVHICVTDSAGASYICTYTGVISCGSNAGCREHDACYDYCAEVEHETSLFGPCHRRCDEACREKYGAKNCVSWARGKGPFDSRINFSNPPTQSSCPTCTTCNSTMGTCDPMDCGSPCLVCVNNSCQPKVCPDCTTCNPNNNGSCDPVVCGPCLECVNNSCQPKACTGCTACNPDTGNCEPVNCNPANCEICVDGACIDGCSYAQPGAHCCTGVLGGQPIGVCCPPEYFCCTGPLGQPGCCL